MAKAIKIDNLLERGLAEPEEAANLDADWNADAEAAAKAEQEAAGLTPPPAEQPPAEAAKPAEQQQPPAEETVLDETKVSEGVRKRFHDLTEARKAAETEREIARREVQELREKWARLDERRSQAAEAEQRFNAQSEAAKRAAERPDPAIDPQGAELFDLKMGREQDRRELEELKRQVVQGTQQTAATLEQQQMLNYLRNDVSRFEREHPDYQQAAAYAAQKRTEFWMNVGYGEAQARNIVQQETAAIVKAGVDNGRSIAQTVYQLATQWGHNAGAANGNGATQQPAAEGTVAAQEKLRQVAAGQAVQGMPKTATEASSGDNIAKLSAAQIAAMDEDVWMRIMSTPAGARAMNQRMRDLEMGG